MVKITLEAVQVVQFSKKVAALAPWYGWIEALPLGSGLQPKPSLKSYFLSQFACQSPGPSNKRFRSWLALLARS